MKILFLSELFYPHGGGAEFATYLIAKELAMAGHQVQVIANEFEGEPERSVMDGFTVIRKPLLSNPSSVKYSMLLQGGSFSSRWLVKLVEWSDIVYVPRYWYSSIPLVKKLGKPLIVHLHDYIPICPVANLFDSRSNQICLESRCSAGCIYSYERLKGTDKLQSNVSSVLNSTIGRYMGWMIKGSDAVICVSHAQRQLIADRVPELDGKSSVIYNPLPDLQSIPMRKKGFVYFGGASPMKGFQVLTQSISKVRNESFKIKAAGFRDAKWSGKVFPDKRVDLLGWVSEKDLSEVYSEVNAVLVPSIWAEPAPYVVYEAILRGRLVIGSRIGGIPEQLEGYEGCLLVEPGDPSDLAENMEIMLGFDLVEAQGFADLNRSKLIKMDHNQRMLESFEALMNRLLASRM
jgi:glycosyltransferase involved in cell wall biosynthesis